MSASKIAVLVLILLAVLFAVGVGLGSRGSSDPGGLSWVDSLGSALTPSVDFDKLVGPCLNRQTTSFVIASGASCGVSIPGVKSRTRKLALRLTGGTQVDGQYVAPPGHEKIDPDDESGNQSVTIDGTKEVSLVILKEGGTLTLVCRSQEEVPCSVAEK